jgi:hypothetical protein
MKLACIVLAHHLPQQLAQLVSALRHPWIQVYVHIDRRKSLAPFTRAFAETGSSDLVLLPRHKSWWSSPGTLDAALEGLVAGVADGCDYFITISGQDFPLKPMEEIASFFERAESRSYISHWPVSEFPRRWRGRERIEFYTYTVRGRREVCIPRGEDVSFFNWRGRLLNELLRARTAFMPPRRHPPYVRPFLGSDWWNITRVAADYVLRFHDEHPDFRRWHEYTLAPGDMFVHSILLGTDFARDHEIVNDRLRFVIGQEGSPHPRTLTTDDRSALLESEKLFARKFDQRVDAAVLEQLAARITDEAVRVQQAQAGEH